ncbi:hypothetical protein [Herbiconiux sp. YIM B11900]|uniref:hypothetical protein n=1 Tax=Herbiconiux sp. YIM B11900 TaxID=3404131 RepID=UPI003F842A47
MTTTWRFFPPRKPPPLPPKGEKWGGLLRPATFVSLGIAVVLVVAVVVGLSVSRSTAPTTLEGVTAEVMTEVDAITAILRPADAADEAALGAPVDSTTLDPCPDDGPGEQVTVTRVIPLPPTASPADLTQAVADAYTQREWSVRTEAYGTEGSLRTDLLGKNLIPVELTIAPTTDAASPAATPALTATIRSASRCTSGS